MTGGRRRPDSRPSRRRCRFASSRVEPRTDWTSLDGPGIVRPVRRGGRTCTTVLGGSSGVGWSPSASEPRRRLRLRRLVPPGPSSPSWPSPPGSASSAGPPSADLASASAGLPPAAAGLRRSRWPHRRGPLTQRPRRRATRCRRGSSTGSPGAGGAARPHQFRRPGHRPPPRSSRYRRGGQPIPRRPAPPALRHRHGPRPHPWRGWSGAAMTRPGHGLARPARRPWPPRRRRAAGRRHPRAHQPRAAGR